MDSPSPPSDEVQPHPLLRNQSSLRLLTELSRERIALRHLDSWKALYRPEFLDRNAFPTAETPMPTPAACLDTGLAAFAQLATLRIGVRRAFVTIMSRDVEYVLVEATRTMALQSDAVSDPKDQMWLGTSCFARDQGMNGAAIDGWRKARKFRELPERPDYYYTEGLSNHWCIYSDLGENAEAQKRPFVSQAHSPRFYFSVPLRDQEGSVLGSLTLLDDKPRYGVSAAEMLFSEDLADTIAQHILASTITLQRQRSEHLIQALGAFNSGGNSLRDWWMGQDNATTNRMSRQRLGQESNSQRQARFTSEFGAGEDDALATSTPPSDRDTEATLSLPSRRLRVPRSASDGNDQAATDRTDNHVGGIDFGELRKQSSAFPPGESSTVSHTPSQMSQQPPASSTTTSKIPLKGSSKASKPSDTAGQLAQAYSRASNLLRESLGAAGVVFFDASSTEASRSTARSQTGSTRSSQASPSGSGRSTTASDDSKAPTNSDTDHSDMNEPQSRQCHILGSSTQVQSSEETRQSPLHLSDKDMAKLIKSYPYGKVFTFATSGSPYSASEDSMGSGGSSESAAGTTTSQRVNTRHSRHARMLRKVVGDARSIAFHPIWDSSNEKYRCCLFAWTLHPNRFFDSSEDMVYLSAFGHSLRAELSRIETIASDAAKGKFISSVSHELRSPLHGILAGVELLQDSQLSPFQEEMALSVALAGRTLLDTVNHILDYSKISNLTRDQKTDRARVDTTRHKALDTHGNPGQGLIHVDLAQLTEEVVESCTSAYRFSQSFKQESIDSNGSSSAGKLAQQPDKEDLSVTLDIDNRANWKTAITPGSWTRVLTNLVGNALKYTPSGTISVRLSAEVDDTLDDEPATVTLKINDTGIGMSKEFVSNGLFTPFRQADAHSVGTGLGLSIVREVAKEFNGSLGVSSEVGKGTSITLRFAAKFTESGVQDNDLTELPPTSRARNFCLLQPANTHSPTDHTRDNHVAQSLQRTASQWLKCNVSTSQKATPEKPGSLCVISEQYLLDLHTARPEAIKTLVNTLAESGCRLLIFAQSVASTQPKFKFDRFEYRPIYLHQPIGPRKLVRAIKHARDSTNMQHARKATSPTTRAFTSATQNLISGDTPHSDLDAQGQTGSYFEIPHDQHSRASSSVMTPTSFMDASTQKTPDPTAPVAVQEDEVVPAVNEANEQGDTTLLVEDNAINMRLLVALMRKQRLHYDCAENGLEALQMYKVNPKRYFLILMDMSMPVMDGFESTAKIREFERKQKIRETTIAAFTGVTNEESRNNAYNAGVSKYLTKPMQMADLTRLVAETREEMESA